MECAVRVNSRRMALKEGRSPGGEKKSPPRMMMPSPQERRFFDDVAQIDTFLMARLIDTFLQVTAILF